MKVGFLLQRRFAYVGHAMALTFKKKYGITEFCGYVYMRSSYDFLKSQNDIQYMGLLLDDEIHKHYQDEVIDPEYLGKFEHMHGMPNLWPYITLDRIVRYGLFLREYPHDTPPYSHKEMIKIFQAKARAITKFIEEEKPDIIIFSAIAGIGSLLLYQIAKSKKIKTFVLREARIHTKYSVSEDYRSMSYIDKAFREIAANPISCLTDRQSAEKFLRDFRANPAPYYYTESPSYRPTTRKKQFRFLSPAKIGGSILWIGKIFYSYFFDAYRDDYETIKPWHHLIDRIKRKTRVLVGYGGLYEKTEDGEDYAFFPLQLEPEIASMLYAPFFTDQLWLIKQIAYSLPLQYKLYVKEHPAMFGFRTRSFYKELKKIPNVKLIPPTVSGLEIVKNSRLITTVSGTAGWEGVLLGKPVITFGDVFYAALPMVARCRSIEDLPHLIKNRLENFRQNDKSLLDFITAIFKEGVDVDLNRLWTQDGGSNMAKKEKELIPLVDYIAGKIDLKTLI